MPERTDSNSDIRSCDAYFDVIQSRKRLPYSMQESLTPAFVRIPVSSFPEVPRGKVIEISSDTPIIDAVRILSEHNIPVAPVKSIVESCRWAPFLPVASDSCMLTVLLFLSKYRLRNVPVIELEKPYIKNFITKSAIMQGLNNAKEGTGSIASLCALFQILDFPLCPMMR